MRRERALEIAVRERRKAFPSDIMDWSNKMPEWVIQAILEAAKEADERAREEH